MKFRIVEAGDNKFKIDISSDLGINWHPFSSGQEDYLNNNILCFREECKGNIKILGGKATIEVEV